MANRWRTAVMISAVMAAAAVAASSAQVAGARATLPRADVPTYSKDVAPIVQKNCQVCHRPGELH
jgi:cytochrome c5